MNVNHKPILNDFELPTFQLGCTNLLKELVTELWIGNSKMLCKLASKGLLHAPGSSLHDCSYSSVAPIFFSNLVIILSCRIINGLRIFCCKGHRANSISMDSNIMARQ
jgi:hypothetical protein